jgi:hypothetical protein
VDQRESDHNVDEDNANHDKGDDEREAIHPGWQYPQDQCWNSL